MIPASASLPCPFYKMQALGNDFMVIEGLTQPLPQLTPAHIAQWGDRRQGIGFDQCLVITPPPTPDTDFGYQIYNQDGSTAYQCGNGLRCVALLVQQLGLHMPAHARWQTARGDILETQVHGPHTVWSALPSPVFLADPTWLDLPTGPLSIAPVSVGNPHAVIWDPPVPRDPHWETVVFEQLQTHPVFPEGANVSFITTELPYPTHTFQIRTYERGAGLTPACGSAAAAAYWTGRVQQRLTAHVTIPYPTGMLQLTQGAAPVSPIEITGPAYWVYSGVLQP